MQSASLCRAERLLSPFQSTGFPVPRAHDSLMYSMLKARRSFCPTGVPSECETCLPISFQCSRHKTSLATRAIECGASLKSASADSIRRAAKQIQCFHLKSNPETDPLARCSKDSMQQDHRIRKIRQTRNLSKPQKANGSVADTAEMDCLPSGTLVGH